MSTSRSIWEWRSIKPGIKYNPLASITKASFGILISLTFPTLTILLSFIKTIPFLIIPFSGIFSSIVKIVQPLNTIDPLPFNRGNFKSTLNFSIFEYLGLFFSVKSHLKNELPRDQCTPFPF